MGKEAHAETNGVVPERDSAEIALLQAALERDMPVLAVCRGSQVLNVALGGDLVQHLPDVVGDASASTPRACSPITTSMSCRAPASSESSETRPVKGHHHQGYGRLGEGLQEAAR